MSERINQLYDSWKSLEQSVRGTHITYRGSTLTGHNVIVVQDGLLLLAHVWVDCFAPELSLVEIPRWIPRWIKTIEGIDWFDFVRFMKDCDTLLLSQYQIDIDSNELLLSSYDDFKHRLRKEYSFAGDILSPARKTIESYLNSHSSGDAFPLHEAFAFIGRITLRDIPELADEMQEKFERNCERIMMFDHDFATDPEVDIIHEWFSFPIDSPFMAKHGNGAVAEEKVYSIADKYRCGGPDPLLQYVARSRGVDVDWPFSETTLRRISRLQLVPKSSTTYRTVTMEPACLMYFQQGVKNYLDELIRRHPDLRRHIDLTDQNPSRSLCAFASVDGSLDTIDLSMASDSISLRLVKAWFRGTWIYPFLIAARSSSVKLPDGRIMELPIYAGMGSAITFRLECIIFAAICESTIREVGRKLHSRPFRIYGDDIIIDHRYTARLIENLENRGFQVNIGKSFTSTSPFGIFRESCGAECLNGWDIKPCRIPRGFTGIDAMECLNEDPTRYGTLISLANDCLDHGLFQCRWWVTKSLLSLPYPFRPLFGENDSCLHSLYLIQNHHLERKYICEYQCYYATHGVVSQKCGRKRQDERIRLYETLRLINDRDDSSDTIEPISVSRPKPPSLTTTETSLCF